MKRIYSFMLFAGMLVALCTAGGCDSGIIGSGQILIQSVVSAALVIIAMLGKGAEA